jgi:hypothetical protein
LDRRLAAHTPAELTDLTREWAAVFTLPEVTLAVARDAQGRPMAVVAAVVDENICLICVAVACQHAARWALHDHLVRLLIGRGVKYLLSEGGGPFGALGYEPEVHHYQRLLGYELRHLVPRSAHPLGAARRRLSLNPLAWHPAGSRGYLGRMVARGRRA